MGISIFFFGDEAWWAELAESSGRESRGAFQEIRLGVAARRARSPNFKRKITPCVHGTVRALHLGWRPRFAAAASPYANAHRRPSMTDFLPKAAIESLDFRMHNEAASVCDDEAAERERLRILIGTERSVPFPRFVGADSPAAECAADAQWRVAFYDAVRSPGWCRAQDCLAPRRCWGTMPLAAAAECRAARNDARAIRARTGGGRAEHLCPTQCVGAPASSASALPTTTACERSRCCRLLTTPICARRLADGICARVYNRISATPICSGEIATAQFVAGVNWAAGGGLQETANEILRRSGSRGGRSALVLAPVDKRVDCGEWLPGRMHRRRRVWRRRLSAAAPSLSCAAATRRLMRQTHSPSTRR